jgi:hypothetical protein
MARRQQLPLINAVPLPGGILDRNFTEGVYDLYVTISILELEKRECQ